MKHLTLIPINEPNLMLANVLENRAWWSNDYMQA